MIFPHHGIWPRIHETAFIAPSADVVGDVVIGDNSSVWFQVVIRGDVNSVHIGNRTNIQDHSCLHVTRKVSPLKIGDECTLGHRSTVHGCTIGNRVLVGMGAIVLDDAEIGDDCIIAAGAVVTKGTKVPSGSLVMGMPAKVSRPLKDAELAFLKKSASNYVGDIAEYKSYVRGPRRMGDNNDDLETDVDFEEVGK
jgi:carbonic anhydrase/acetyltransferase-like protein (isoleucine patch superfamily)